MNFKLVDKVLRLIALPACGGLALMLVFGVTGWLFPIHRASHPDAVGVDYFRDLASFGLIGAVLSSVFGWPLLALTEWLFVKYRFRYVVGGVLCSTLIWLILDAPIFPKDWHFWTDSAFWFNGYHGLRIISIYSAIGLTAGSLYSLVVVGINRWIQK